MDVDSLRWCYPRQPADPFRVQLALRNLSLIWPNFAAAGARRLVLVDVVESTADLHRIVAAVPGADIRLVRLRARLQTLQARVQQREQGLGRDRMLRRALELATQLDAHPIEDVLVETDNRPISDISSRRSWSGVERLARRRRHVNCRDRPPSRGRVPVLAHHVPRLRIE